MPKLIIQIPCLNEAKTLPATLAALPRQIDGIDAIETLIIDDGSTDDTVAVARRCGVDHVVRFTSNRGLARAFAAGLNACLHLGADVIVHTDADGQYPGADIPRLVEPILRGEADMVVGDRGVSSVAHFSPVKRLLQGFGSRTVSALSGIDVGDVTSGFRAYSREAALRLNIITNFTYTLETIMQSGEKPITIATVPTSSNPPTRPSRLFAGVGQYLRRQVPTILRLYWTYQPLKTFTLLAALFLAGGLILGVRFLAFYISGTGAGHVQSLILAAILLIIGVQILIMGMVGDLLAANRRLMEDTLYRVRKIELMSLSSVKVEGEAGALQDPCDEEQAR
ncbi:MAG: glycosyltransferase family 2 protein [Anaerolineae bacterium]|nr:glycosyltransferase family 2 protein [Anaerolineae bacterium]